MGPRHERPGAGPGRAGPLCAPSTQDVIYGAVVDFQPLTLFGFIIFIKPRFTALQAEWAQSRF